MFVLERLSNIVNQIVEFLLFVFGISMALIVTIQVFSRYLLNHSLFWSEELARYLLVWLSFLGASVAYKRELHPGIDIVYNKLSNTTQRFVSIFIHIVSAILFGIMIYSGFCFTLFTKSQISPALSIPKWIIFSIIPISGIILMIHCLVFILQSFKRLKK